MFLNTKEVADRLHVTKMTVSRMVKRGQLTPVNPHKDYFIFEASQIDFLTLKTSKLCDK